MGAYVEALNGPHEKIHPDTTGTFVTTGSIHHTIHIQR